MMVQDPGSNEIEQSYWTRVISWTRWPLDESPKTKKWQMQAKPTWHHFGGKINWLRPEKNELSKG
jgi:hypothetical protein